MRYVPALCLVLLTLPACTRANGLAIDSDGGCGLDCVDLAGADFSGSDLRHRDMDFVPPDLAKPGADLGPMMCVPACNHCSAGVCCAGGVNGCCASGEWCDGSGQCRCGSSKACATGQICATGGPIGMFGQCGTVCCGDPTHPCPL